MKKLTDILFEMSELFINLKNYIFDHVNQFNNQDELNIDGFVNFILSEDFGKHLDFNYVKELVIKISQQVLPVYEDVEEIFFEIKSEIFNLSKTSYSSWWWFYEIAKRNVKEQFKPKFPEKLEEFIELYIKYNRNSDYDISRKYYL